MGQVLWTPVAETDLEDLLFYVAFVDRRPATGDRLYREILDRLAQCAKGILQGHVHHHAPPGWQYIKHKRWLIFFQPHDNGIEVMRIIDGVRDLPRQLRTS